jgi:hypothetical protein
MGQECGKILPRFALGVPYRPGAGLSASPSASPCGYYPADAALLAAAFGRPNLPKARSNQP